MFLVLLVSLSEFTTGVGDAVRARLREARAGGRGEDGLSTLEIVVIALGLFLLAAGAVVVIRSAAQSRLDQIK